MKKLLSLALVAMSIFVLSACGGGAKTPSEVAKAITEAMYNDGVKSTIKYYDMNEEEAKQMEQMAGLMDNKIKATVEEKKGFSGVTVSDEKIEGDKATVKATVKFGDGSEEVSEMNLVQKDGTWKVVKGNN